MKSGTTGDGDCQAFLKDDDEYVIPVPTRNIRSKWNLWRAQIIARKCLYTELDVKGRNTTENGTYEKLVKQDSDYVIPAHERRESYEDI